MYICQMQIYFPLKCSGVKVTVTADTFTHGYSLNDVFVTPGCDTVSVHSPTGSDLDSDLVLAS